MTDNTMHLVNSRKSSTKHPASRAASISDGDVVGEAQITIGGHVAELPQRFSAFSMLTFAFAILNSWIGYVGVFTTVIYMGGLATAAWAPLVAAIPCFIITCGLAELASAFPSTGGQYHYAFMVSPPRLRRPIAFTTGWLSIFAYLFTISSASLFVVQTLFQLVTTQMGDFEPERWQTWLVYTGLLVFATATVSLFPKALPKLQTAMFWFSVLALGVISITLLAISPTKQPASMVFTKWTNQSGWSDGFSFILSIGQCMWLYTCVDTATHVSEEVPNPGKNVPIAMLATVGLGIASTILFSFSMLFSSQDFDRISTSSLPMYELYLQATQKTSLAITFSAWLILIYTGTVFGLIVTTGNLIWAFSRDQGIPFSRFFVKIHPRLKVPMNANIAASTFCILYGLVYIGSSVAFNVFISTSILSLNMSYAIPQVMLLFGDRTKLLPRRYLSLGNYLGPFCNAFTGLWVVLFMVLFCFPLFIPTTAATMSYVSVVVTAMLLFCAALWWGGKRNGFNGPALNPDGSFVSHQIIIQ
ncbi:unnamed protein product [Clonostachys byssicola]|uniref:Choline transport protein n=1 Tax=Clonostachys byssicola TaxID=160290 RepID=A0A9N9UJN6_9HYPO|nr:unnamed protein product [Clonostachys byssicola]